MIHPITKFRSDYCLECDSPRSLECYDVKRSGMNYVLYVDYKERGRDIAEKIEPLDLSYFKCRKCGKLYNIDWRSKFPIPLYDEIAIHRFLLSRKVNNL